MQDNVGRYDKVGLFQVCQKIKVDIEDLIELGCITQKNNPLGHERSTVTLHPSSLNLRCSINLGGRGRSREVRI